MGGGFSRGWALVKAIWQVVQGNRSLLLFPLLSGFVTLIALAAFAVPALQYARFVDSVAAAGSRNNPQAAPFDVGLIQRSFRPTGRVVPQL